jgi:predicted small lipoprotein YifL
MPLALAVGFLAAVAALGAGCGKKGSPVPPSPRATQAPASQEEPQGEDKTEQVEERRKQPLIPP